AGVALGRRNGPARRFDVTRCLHDARDARALGAGELLGQAQRILAVVDVEMAMVVEHRYRERLGHLGVCQVLAALLVTKLDVRHSSSMRGNSGASFVVAVPGRSTPQAPASRRFCSARAPSTPRPSQSFAVESGMTGESRTARAR